MDVNDPGSMPGTSASVTFGFSSQLAMPELPTVLETRAPKIRTGMREDDSTFVCDSSSIWVRSISTDGAACCG